MVNVLRDGNLMIIFKTEEPKVKALHNESICKKVVTENIPPPFRGYKCQRYGHMAAV